MTSYKQLYLEEKRIGDNKVDVIKDFAAALCYVHRWIYRTEHGCAAREISDILEENGHTYSYERFLEHEDGTMAARLSRSETSALCTLRLSRKWTSGSDITDSDTFGLSRTSAYNALARLVLKGLAERREQDGSEQYLITVKGERTLHDVDGGDPGEFQPMPRDVDGEPTTDTLDGEA